MANKQILESASEVSIRRISPVTLTSSGIAAGLGGLFGLMLGPLNVLTIVFLAIAAMILVITVPKEVGLGATSCLAAITMFTLAPTTATRGLQSTASFIAIAFLLIGLFRSRKVLRDGPKRGVVGILLGSIYLLALFVSTFVNGLGTDVGLLFIVSILTPFLALIAARRFGREDMRVFARGFIAFAILQVIVAVIDLAVIPIPFLGYTFVSGVRLSNSLLGDATFRSQGLTSHPIIFALILTIAMILLWRSDVVKLSAAIRFFFFVVLAGGLVLSGTRSAILAVVVGVLFLAILNAKTLATRLRNLAFVVVVSLFALSTSVVQEYAGSILNGLSESGSYTHRAGAFDSIPGLLAGQSTMNLFFGSGAGAEPTLFDRGLLQQDGFNIIDNQFVTTFVVVGLFGTAVLFAMILRSIFVGDAMIRALVLVMMVMFNSFDFLRWAGPEMVFFLVIGLSDNPLFGSFGQAELVDADTLDTFTTPQRSAVANPAMGR